jgi:hypothetical protein
MGWIGFLHCEKFRCDFMAQTYALIAPVQPILHRVSCSKEKLYQVHPNTTKHTNTWVLGPIGWIGCVHCQKFQCDFMPRTCALILPLQPTLHRVSCSNEIIQNAPKLYKTHQNMSLGSNGVDWVGSLQKIPMRLRGTTFCINCSSWARFAPSFMQ